jgi:ubiquitin C-terminal hydrolase
MVAGVADLFCGQLQSRVQCLTCKRYSFCFDPFMDISVPVPKVRW